MNTVEILTQARAKIADPEHWTQHVYARAANGGEVWYDDVNACAWCATGAVLSIVAGQLGNQACYALTDAAKIVTQYTQRGAVGLNDKTNHETVLAMYDLAIKNAAVGQAAA